MIAPIEIGERFGRLIVIEHTPTEVRIVNGRKRWKSTVKVRCDCGTEKVVKTGDLRRARTSSCGCLMRERFAEANAAARARRNAERREDLRWMVETNESLTGAATRLGMSPESLERWCDRHGLVDELAVLRAREPFYVVNEWHATRRRDREDGAA